MDVYNFFVSNYYCTLKYTSQVLFYFETNKLSMFQKETGGEVLTYFCLFFFK